MPKVSGNSASTKSPTLGLWRNYSYQPAEFLTCAAREPCSPVGWVRARDEQLYLHKRRAPVTQQCRRNTEVLGYARIGHRMQFAQSGPLLNPTASSSAPFEAFEVALDVNGFACRTLCGY